MVEMKKTITPFSKNAATFCLLVQHIYIQNIFTFTMVQNFKLKDNFYPNGDGTKEAFKNSATKMTHTHAQKENQEIHL